MRNLWLSILLSVSAGCASPPAASSPPLVVEVPPRMDSGAADAPTDVTEGEAGTPDSAPGKETPSPFHVVVKGYYLTSHHLGSSVFVTDSKSMAELRGDSFVQDPDLVRGLQGCGAEPFSFMGTWPSAAYATSNWVPWAVRSPVGQLYKRTGQGWVRQSSLNLHQLIAVSWSGGSVLALEVPRRTGPGWGYRLKLLQGPARYPVPQPEARVRTPGPSGGGNCYTRLEFPIGLLAFESGEVMVVGSSECGMDEDSGAPIGVVVERFSGKKRAFDTIPFLGGDSAATVVSATSPTNVWIAARSSDATGEQTRLARFDGNQWHDMGEGPEGTPLALAVEPRNSRLWLLLTGKGDSRLYQQVKDRGWEPVSLPKDVSNPTGLWVRGEGDVWVDAENAILRTIPSPGVLAWVDGECVTSP